MELEAEFEPVIGLEIHAQLQTRTKLFCACPVEFGGAANSHTCPVCLGLPGALPVPNEHAVRLATRAALGLGCTVHARSQWARKSYFYPDLPKGYQLTQYDRPIATDGTLRFSCDGTEQSLRIVRLHMEEDAGKSIHDAQIAGHHSIIDLNRAGTPLCEIVTAPELHSAEAAAAAMRAMRQLLRYLEVCDGNLEEGSLRCDANVSVRPKGQSTLGTRTELKNINSFRFVEAAITYEVSRQIQTLRGGGQVVLETRAWDSGRKVTQPLRSKEEAHDYRYFTDPDLPDLVLPDGFVDRVRTSLGELPEDKKRRYVALGLSSDDASLIVEEVETAVYLDACVQLGADAKKAANWIIHELLPKAAKLEAKDLTELLALIERGTLSTALARQVLAEALETKRTPKDIVAARGLSQQGDASALEALVDTVLAKEPDAVRSVQGGEHKALGFLVGKVMKESGSRANAKLVQELLRKKLGIT